MNFFTRPKTLAGHVDDSVANPIWPSSSAIPLCAIELLFRAASQRKRYCKTSNQLRLFDSITLNFKLSIYMEQKN